MIKYNSLVPALPVIFLMLFFGCSRIEIEKPAENEKNITTPYTLVVKHTGCGSVRQETFQAWLDKDSDASVDISDIFSYSQDTWTASDYDLPMGNHSLWVTADVTTGGWCRKAKTYDERSFFIAPCTDFVTAWGDNFEMAPDTLFIEYNGTVVKIPNGETKVINLPEDSPLIVDGKLPATTKFGISNTTTNNLKFRMILNHAETALYWKDLAFCGEGIVNEEHPVTISPSSEPMTISIEAGDILASPSDDTRPIFFSGKLQLRIYPL